MPGQGCSSVKGAREEGVVGSKESQERTQETAERRAERSFSAGEEGEEGKKFKLTSGIERGLDDAKVTVPACVCGEMWTIAHSYWEGP